MKQLKFQDGVKFQGVTGTPPSTKPILKKKKKRNENMSKKSNYFKCLFFKKGDGNLTCALENLKKEKKLKTKKKKLSVIPFFKNVFFSPWRENSQFSFFLPLMHISPWPTLTAFNYTKLISLIFFSFLLQIVLLIGFFEDFFFRTTCVNLIWREGGRRKALPRKQATFFKKIH